ncbi:1-(5-phosphoribosyl)-5-[(5-phosphoribosylamino)methylideneamino]imidazole-4-carboxamide isomerase [Companilactobacillus jidongensis]|uniref:1-(5-phosphoribosyl)-5-[(5- phosphoribosylamino)methylideneamino]imidazole-4- carboxamide isomerase n=1 Tax=Companilactobacillus jidongensis TaxID=2486006 RepID=UPI000F76CD9B|nr:1-(5-phosphoribosyl)-5-[(5-phosphoribosylamino)methylideneamino]imidazole-4-carboxamide isomerase [Companilactobacillus jidongensis]
MIFPAIDIHNGQSVRLFKGDYQRVTLINKDPLEQTKQISAADVNQIHIVDLDGAKSGKPQNYNVISSIRNSFSGFLEMGGGIRNYETARNYLELGIDRIIIGSAAIEEPFFVKQLLQEYGSERIVISVDGEDGKVAVNGWLDQSNVLMEDLIRIMVDSGAKHFIVTDVSRDGTMTGPNLDLLFKLKQDMPEINFIANGGIRDLRDLHRLKAFGLTDVIIGKALYEGTITLKQISNVSKNIRQDF